MNKKTDDLFRQLTVKNSTYEEYLCNNEDCFMNTDISQFWKKIIADSNMKKNNIINKANIGYTFFYDILNGKKHPSRDVLIKILLVMGCDINIFQEALRIYEWADLYPKIKRDSILIYAINHNYSLEQTSEMLGNNGEKTL